MRYFLLTTVLAVALCAGAQATIVKLGDGLYADVPVYTEVQINQMIEQRRADLHNQQVMAGRAQEQAQAEINDLLDAQAAGEVNVEVVNTTGINWTDTGAL